MQHPYFQRFLSTQTMMQAEYELLDLGAAAVPILASLFSGEARDETGLPFRQHGLALRCAIEVAVRLGPAAKPLESYLRAEVGRGHDAAPRALRGCQPLEPDTVAVLAQSLSGDDELALESAVTLIACGEERSAPVIQAIASSPEAASVISRARRLPEILEKHASPDVTGPEQDFESLPLHDASLVDIYVAWGIAYCHLRLLPAGLPEHLLVFASFTHIELPHTGVWGPSVSVNTLTQVREGLYEIELQSGDVIRIEADQWDFRPEFAGT